jgi:hypothetical protein
MIEDFWTRLNSRICYDGGDGGGGEDDTDDEDWADFFGGDTSGLEGFDSSTEVTETASDWAGDTTGFEGFSDNSSGLEGFESPEAAQEWQDFTDFVNGADSSLDLSADLGDFGGFGGPEQNDIDWENIDLNTLDWSDFSSMDQPAAAFTVNPMGQGVGGGNISDTFGLGGIPGYSPPNSFANTPDRGFQGQDFAGVFAGPLGSPAGFSSAPGSVGGSQGGSVGGSQGGSVGGSFGGAAGGSTGGVAGGSVGGSQGVAGQGASGIDFGDTFDTFTRADDLFTGRFANTPFQQGGQQAVDSRFGGMQAPQQQQQPQQAAFFNPNAQASRGAPFAGQIAGATNLEALRNYGKAVAQIESGGQYSKVHSVIPSGPMKGQYALGAYGIMSGNLAKWSKEALGREVSEREFLANPILQDRIFENRFQGYVDKYGPDKAAAAWLAGETGMKNNTQARDMHGTGIGKYVGMFNNLLNGFNQTAARDSAFNQGRSAGAPTADEFDQFGASRTGAPAPAQTPPGFARWDDFTQAVNNEREARSFPTFGTGTGQGGPDLGVNFGRGTGLEGFGGPSEFAGGTGLEGFAGRDQGWADLFGPDFNLELGPTHQSNSPEFNPNNTTQRFAPEGPTDPFSDRFSFADPFASRFGFDTPAQAAPQPQQQPPPQPQQVPQQVPQITVNPQQQPQQQTQAPNPFAPQRGQRGATPSFAAPPGQDIGAPGMGFDPTASYAGALDPRLKMALNLRGNDNDGAVGNSFGNYMKQQFPTPSWDNDRRTRMDAHGQAGLAGMGQLGDTGIANALFQPHRFTGADGTAMQHPAPWDDRMDSGGRFGLNLTSPNPGPDMRGGDIGAANQANFQRINDDWGRAMTQATPDTFGQWQAGRPDDEFSEMIRALGQR